MMDRKHVRARLCCYLVIGVMLPWTGESFAVEAGPFLLYGGDGSIGIDPLKENSSCTSLWKKKRSLVWDVDYNLVDNQIYWSSSGAVYRAHFNGSSTSLPLAGVSYFAVDSTSRLLFYSQRNKRAIAVMSLTSDTQKVVLRPHKPINNLALDSQHGVIFWTEHRARIKRANYDGSNNRTILEDGNPRYLALDLDKQHIYWTSGYKLERSDLSGEGRTQIYASPVNDKVYIWDLAYSKSQLYWVEQRMVDSLNSQIKQMDLHNNKTKTLCRFKKIIWALHVHPDNDVVANKCTKNNGGCSHICIPTPSKGKKCLCPDGLALQDDDTTCGSSTPPPESTKTKDLKRLAQGNGTHETVTETKFTLMKQPGQTSAEDVAWTAELVYRASRLNNIIQQTAKDVLEIVDFVSNLNQTVLEQSNAKGNTTNRMIKAVEEISDQISLKEGEVRLETNATFIRIRSLTTVTKSSDVSFQLLNPEDSTHGSNQSSQDGYVKEAEVILPGEVVSQIVKEFAGRDIRVSTSGFLDTGLFRVGRKSDERDSGDNSADTSAEDRPKGSLSSKVVSMRITVDGQPITDLSSYEPGQVTTIFQLGQLEEATSCVFWDFDLEQGYGGWSQEGCQVKDIRHGEVYCTCNHLTNFAVLMDFYGHWKKELDDHDSVLGTISVMGLTFSICSLFLTLLFFMLVTELRQSLVHQALSHMALALFLSYVTFLAGIQRVADRVGCVVVAMVLHYLILASFLWMLAQGVLYYVTIVKGRSPSAKRFISMAAVLAWAINGCLTRLNVGSADAHKRLYVVFALWKWVCLSFLLPLRRPLTWSYTVEEIITFGDHRNHLEGRAIHITCSEDFRSLYRTRQGGTTDCVRVPLASNEDIPQSTICWMSLTLLYYAFLTPIAVVVVINLVIYVLVMVSICRGPRSTRDNSNNLAYSARVSFSCFCVMGLSWVFAFLAVEGAQPVFQYLFTFSTTFTGLFIFLMYTARHPAVKAFGIQCANRIRGTSATPPYPDLHQGPAVLHVAMREMN